MMKARRSVFQVLTPVLLVCLLALTCMAYAAPAATQKATQQVKPATSPTSAASVKYDPNAPPQGTITINASSKGNVNASTWYTGSYQYIQWTCNGTRTNLADVTLWQSNRQVATIWTGSATGQTAYVVPMSMAAGSYEVHVTSEDDTRIEARFTVNIVPTTVTLTTPPGALLSSSPYTITWTYTGNIQSVKLTILDSSGAVVQDIPNISAGTNGNGVWPWTVPTLPAGKTSVQYRFQISGTFLTSAASSAKTDSVLGTSDLFTVRLPKIEVGSFLLKANVAECSPGRTYQIIWNSELNGKPVKVELYKTYAGTVVQTIQANVPSQASNSISWTVPSIPETLDRTQYLNIRVTSLDFPSAKGEGDVFSCEKPWISLTSPDPQQTLYMNQTYQIGWQYGGDPGPHVRVDLMSSKTGGYNLQVFETPAQSAAMQGSSGKWGQGQISWNLTNKGPQSQFYIQLTGVENTSVYDRRQYYIGYGSGTTGSTVSGTTSTGSTGSTGTSTTTGTTSGSSGTGSTSQKVLTSDTSVKYSANRSATFKGGTTVNLDGNGYAVNGYLSMSDQLLDYNSGKSTQIMGGSYVTFSGGYVTSGYLTLKSNQLLEYRSGRSATFQSGAMTKFSNGYVISSLLSLAGGDQLLEYRTGKSVSFLPGGKITLSNGYVVSGFLALGSDQFLDYASGKSARFYAGSFVNISNGYITSGYLSLAGSQYLDYSSGKSAPFMAGSFVVFRSGGYVKSAFVGAAATFATTKGTQAVPALSYVTFDDNGYLASFNPPGFSACYKCDPQMDPTCSNSGGLPPCK
jgi:hypothetical protein